MNRVVSFALLTLTTVSLFGCRGQQSSEPPIVPIRNMYTQPRYNAQSTSEFFQDGRSMRPIVEGTVAREMDPDITVATGRTPDNTAWLLGVPDGVKRRFGQPQAMLQRGQERYNIYCAPCHSEVGDGNGMIAQRATHLGFAAIQPPTFHEDRIRHLPDGQIYATITNGLRNMPAYKQSIQQDDRWAIVSYVRALQLSSAANSGDLARAENPDRDADGVRNEQDRCPDERGPAGNGGCPDLDGDGDGVPDRADNCPTVPGTAENLGCAERQLVRIAGERLEILQKVFFATGKADIQERSFRLLDNVASVLLAHEEIPGVQVEGHTDSAGSAARNRALSQRRAQAVRRYLIGKGVPGGRLTALGFGPDQPVQDNATPEGAAANRRVEFRIMPGEEEE